MSPAEPNIIWVVCLESKSHRNDIRSIRFDNYDDATSYIKTLSKSSWNISLIEETTTTLKKILFHNK